MQSATSDAKGHYAHFAWVGTGVLLAATILLGVLAAHKVGESVAWQTNTLNVLNNKEALLSGLVEAESDERGYLLTGDEAFLMSYRVAAGSLADTLGNLRRLTADQPAQQPRLNRLQSLVMERLALLQAGIDLRLAGDDAAAIALVASGRGAGLMDEIGAMLDVFERHENGLLSQRSAQLESDLRRLTLGVALSAFLAVVVAAFAYYRVVRLGEETRRRAAFQQTLLDNIDAAIISATPDGLVTTVNRSGERLLGYTEQELVGRRTPAVFHDDAEMTVLAAELGQKLERSIEAGFEALAALAQTGGADNREVTYVRKDGSRFPATLTLSEMRDGKGRSIGFLGIARDNTERKAAEAALVKAKEAAELANHTKDSFLATMSHEIRTPLGGLLGMLELLGFTQLTDDQRETLRAAHDSGRSLLRIVNDILDWSKIEAGKLALAPQATSLSLLVAGVTNTYARVASARSLILEHHVDPRMRTTHVVDPLRLSQILNNFVSNAMKFTPRRGRVDVRAVRLEGSAAIETIRFSVTDSGIGMDEEIRSRLFESFSQGSADTARMYGGTGLGLAICKRLAEMMDGRIDVESAPGKGSTFSLTIDLPVSTEAPDRTMERYIMPEPVAVRSLKHAPPPADAPTVLVVDDHPTNRKLMSIQAGLLGLRAETAENGETALLMWQRGSYSAVITDCHMPRMDGYELAHQIRKRESDLGRPRTPIVAWTANALPDEAARCHEAGMDELLVKPAGLPQLKAVLSGLIEAPVLANDNFDADGGPVVAIDFGELDELVSSDAEKADVLREFMAQARSDLVELETALAQPDIAAAERIAHRMKGASRMVGARELTAACVIAQNTARQGQAFDVSALRNALARLERHLVASGYPNVLETP